MSRTMTTERSTAWIEPGLNQREPAYTAFSGDDYIAAADRLDELLRDVLDEPNDLAIWRRDGVLAAIVTRGQVQTFTEDKVFAPPSPAQDAKLALLKRRRRMFSIKRRPRV